MACVKSWQVYNFGSYLPIKTRDQVSHTAIQITYTDGSTHIYEWGEETIGATFEKNTGVDYYHYHDRERAWFGVKGQSGKPIDTCITEEMIDTANEDWLSTHNAGGQYPHNCRGYAHYIIRYMKGSETPDEPLPIGDPAYDSTCASSQYKPKRKMPEPKNQPTNQPTNSLNKLSRKRYKVYRGTAGKKTIRTKISKRSRHTMKTRRTKQ